MGVGDVAREPRSIRMGVLPSSAIMMLPVFAIQSLVLQPASIRI